MQAERNKKRRKQEAIRKTKKSKGEIKGRS
jgi:hypothetical protein